MLIHGSRPQVVEAFSDTAKCLHIKYTVHILISDNTSLVPRSEVTNVLNKAPPKSSKMEKLVILCFKTFKTGKKIGRVSGNSVV